MVKGQNIDEALEASYRFLSYRQHSEQELRLRLKRQFPTDVVEQALARLKAAGLIDDAAFARSWRESRDSHNPRSSALLKRELLRKGVPEDIANSTTEDLDNETSAYKAASKLATKLSRDSYLLFRRKLWSYLTYRGFSSGVIGRTIERLWSGEEEP